MIEKKTIEKKRTGKMEKAHFLLILFIVSGCAASGASDKDVLTAYDLAKKVTHENRDYYIVDTGDIKRANKPSNITYVGTVDTYHLFREWAKMKAKEGEIFFFAIAKSSCVVYDEATPENEHSYYENISKQRRHISFEKDKCLVAPRKNP